MPGVELRLEYEPWRSVGRLYHGDTLLDAQRDWVGSVGPLVEDASLSVRAHFRRPYLATLGLADPSSLLTLTVAGSVQRGTLRAAPPLSLRPLRARVLLCVVLLVLVVALWIEFTTRLPGAVVFDKVGALVLFFGALILLATRQQTVAASVPS